ncbi:unnamed protein product [Durusdinium trenchii]|uniref:Uncharacterized protein n=1 Tax=Durusdinium trenchii TaxID=1381693 RepID=A0ABP0P8Z5_9DINO
MEPEKNLQDKFCIQCSEYFVRASPRHDAHDQVHFNTEGHVSEDTLCSLLVSLFTVYSDRPCLGTPTGGCAQWNWVSYAQVKKRVISYIRFLRGSESIEINRFLVAAFPQNCLELIAFDLAAALLGTCSVIAQGAEHAREIVSALGEERCEIISGPIKEKVNPSQANFDFEELLWTGGDKDVLFSLFATSGSTGTPKLVRRTRGSWLDTVRDTAQFGGHLCITLNFTSFAHSAARTELWWNLACGGQTALADVHLELLDSLEALSPTEIAAPPAVWSEIRSALLNRGVFDFDTLQRNMGRLLQNLHTVSTSSASCEPGLFSFLEKVFGKKIMVFDNYGATEVGCIALNGKQQGEVKLVEIPEQGIFSPQGEVCIQADAFEGYYGQQFQQEGVLTEDGYYRTGDIAEKTELGEIRVIGRLSNMVKLSNGKLESLDFIDKQIMQTLQAKMADVEQVCTLEILGSLAAVVHIPSQEMPPPLWIPCILAHEKFTVENGMLTPSLKLCRRNILAKHEAELRALIEERNSKVHEILSSVASFSVSGIDDTRPLQEYGVTSVHVARIASMLGIPAYLISGASTLRDLNYCIASDGMVRFALADIHTSIQRWNTSSGIPNPSQFDSFDTAGETAWEGPWRRAVVTGATGQIGSHFVRLLQDRGLTVIPVASSLGHDISKPQLGMNDQVYSDCLQSDVIVHCAAIVNWNASYSSVREANVLSILNLARLCISGKPKALLFVGSGVTFPEEEPHLEWLEECANPYMVSKIASEFLIRKLNIRAVVVRAGTIVWHSVTGAHKSSDAYVQLVKAIIRDGLIWDDDDLMDGMNVDLFCKAAYTLFEHRKNDTYNLCGTYTLSALMQCLHLEPRRVPYPCWRRQLLSRCTDDHPLTPLLPHIEADSPPFVADNYLKKHVLSPKCRKVLGLENSQEIVAAGYEAFAKAMASSEKRGPAAFSRAHSISKTSESQQATHC